MRVQQLRLHGLESHCIAETGNVEVGAVVYSNRQEDRLVEGLVGELSLSPRIFSTSGHRRARRNSRPGWVHGGIVSWSRPRRAARCGRSSP
ncbi:hypothetical protein [Kaistia defluvii]|uniref:hypothetical protein n=1 Tax=Kaistia defluvii TaxID=410841 RepID=UPI002B1CECE3|nr:hypothetical protein [Kaistia defluvii]